MKKRIFSKKREAIYNTIASTKTHPTAEWVYNQLKEEYPKLSVGTVYRNISVFKDMGLVKTIGVVNNQERFDACVTPHPHLICKQCSSVVDVPVHIPIISTKIYELLNLEYGIQVEDHSMIFYGLCKSCNIDSIKMSSSS